VPKENPDEKYLFLSDILPTAWHANVLAETGKGDVVAVWGAGPGEKHIKLASAEPLCLQKPSFRQLEPSDACAGMFT